MTAQLDLLRKIVARLPVVALASLLVLSTVSPVFAAGATLTLDPASISTNVGQTFTIKINLDTGGNNTDGARAVLFYDKTLLTATQIIPGTIYKEYPVTAQLIDTNTGTVKISGIADTNATFNGTGLFAQVTFTAKAAGTANVKLDFTQGSTTDSNVADTATSTDILSSVSGTTVTIGGGKAPIGGGSATSSGNKLPNTASIDPTIMLSIVGLACLAGGFCVFTLSKSR